MPVVVRGEPVHRSRTGVWSQAEPEILSFPAGTLVPGGAATLQTVSGHPVIVLAGGTGLPSNAATAFVLPESYRGIELQVVAYITKEQITSENVYLEAGVVDSDGSGGAFNPSVTTFNVTPQVAPHEVVFPDTVILSGSSPGGLVELVFTRDAGDPQDDDGENVNLYAVVIRPAQA